MPKRGALALITTIIGVLLVFNFRTGDSPSLAGSAPTAGIIGAPGSSQPPINVAIGPTPAAPTGRPVPGATPAPTQPPTTSGQGSTSGTFTGNLIRTPYGPVQVAIVIKGGKIVDVQELQLPSDRRLSQQISNYAGPILRTQTLNAQSANINGVSGASYTSQGFYQSLQSALSQVH